VGIHHTAGSLQAVYHSCQSSQQCQSNFRVIFTWDQFWLKLVIGIGGQEGHAARITPVLQKSPSYTYPCPSRRMGKCVT